MTGLVREFSASAVDRSMQWDGKLARKQHARFVDTLSELGVRLALLPPLPDKPEGVLVDDAAVILPELVVIAKPGDESRQKPVETVAAKIATFRQTVRLSPSALLDARDVLRIGRTLYVGQSNRTNVDGVNELTEIGEPFGYAVRAVEYRECRGLKAACSFIPPSFVILNPSWVEPAVFGDFVTLAVADGEPHGAETLTIGDTTLVSSAFPKTAEQLREAGVSTRKVDVSEFHRLNAGIAHLVLLLEPRIVRPLADAIDVKIVRRQEARSSDELFAPAVVHGGVAYVSGQLPIDPASGRVVGEEIEVQTEQALENLIGVLTASGSAASRILRLTFYLAEPKNVDRVMNVCVRVLDGHRPAGSVVPAKTLQPGCLIAVDAIASVGEPANKPARLLSRR
jgi:dimethylargininase